MNAIELNATVLSDKLIYTGQINDAKNVLYKTGRYTMDELANMSDVQLSEELLKDYIYITDGDYGENILLIKKECVAVFDDMAVWLKR